MDPKTQNRLITIGWCVVLALLLVIVGRMWQRDRRNEVRIPASDWSKLMLVLQSVDRDYVDPIDQGAVTEKILPDILSKLDPHSVYLPPVELEAAEQDLQGGFDGIGIQFNVPNDTAVVTHVIAGGPSLGRPHRQGGRPRDCGQQHAAGHDGPAHEGAARHESPRLCAT